MCTKTVHNHIDVGFNVDATVCAAFPASPLYLLFNNLFFTILSDACQAAGKGQRKLAA